MLLKRSNSIHSWSSTISLPSRVFKFTNWVNSLKRTHSISNSYLLISIFAFPKALLLNSHQIRQRILIGSWFYNYYGFIGELLLLSSPSLVHLEIIRRSYVVSDTTALPRVSTSTQSLFTHLLALLLRKGFWAFIIIATRPQRPALQRFTSVWATDLTSSFFRSLISQTVIPSSGSLIEVSLGALDFDLSIPSFQGRSWHSTS